MNTRKAFSFRWGCLILSAVLLAFELWLLALPGIQQDEALFLKPFLHGESALYSVTLGGSHVPVMLMDYIGSLKSLLFWPIFHVWRPGVWSIRLPVCLVSIGTLILFACLIRRVAGFEVALGASLLLATDASFVLTNVFDWGPVALLLLGSAGLLLLLIRFARSESKSALAAAFFLAGVMLWYKAVFAFPLAGILIACATVFPADLWRRATIRTVLIATGSLLIGMSPLLAFNFRTGATLRATSYIERTSAGEKLMMLRHTLDGKALEHYMVRSRPEETLQLHGAPLGELVESWYRTSTLEPGSFLFPVLLASAVALPFLRPSRLFRAIVFAWVAGLSTAALFLASGGAGAGPHHTVLIYPAPQFIVAATAAALAERLRARVREALLTGTVALVSASNLLLLAGYHREAVRNGFSVYWTDASRRLADVIRGERRPVAFLDWGLEAPARIQCGDAIRIAAPFPARPGIVYVTHSAGYRIDESETSGIIKDAGSRGLALSTEKAVADSHGREIISVFSLRPLTPLQTTGNVSRR